MKLKDKIVVITGASKGLGRELALILAKEGCNLVLSGRSKEDLEELSTTIGAISIMADVTNEKQVANLADKTLEKFGRIDIWINNAGIWLPHALIEETDWKRVHEMIEVNLFGTIYGSKFALVQMKKQKSGTIINILSTSALEGRAGSSGYCTSKYATAGFTKSLSLEAKPSGIQVIGIYPGGMKTHLFDEEKPADFKNFMDPMFVAEKIVENLKKENLKEELILKRPEK
ncbi:MAG: SDR family oxidoreductase [Nanoarchaeota archaeon]|nr:SDR family oxidoreductase [Nanoarchaeota archaeon]